MSVVQGRALGGGDTVAASSWSVPERLATVSSSRDREITLAYQTFGDPAAPTFLLITGWFSDLTLWPSGFCELLASFGYHVVRYDNRDSGLSSRTPADATIIGGPPYTMSDLAGDAVALLDSLGIRAAHVAGFAMGGTIAQLVAAEHPDRVLSLTVLQAVGAQGYPAPNPQVRSLLRRPFPTGLTELENHHRELFQAMAGPSFDPADYDARARESKARGAVPARGDIQAMVNASTGFDRAEVSHRISCPVLVVHTNDDPLVSLASATAGATEFPNHRLVALEGIGHGVLPRDHWLRVAEAMHQLAAHDGSVSRSVEEDRT